MIKYAIIVIAACGLSLWLYRCYKWDMNELRGQEALKKALRDAGIREGEKDDLNWSDRCELVGNRLNLSYHWGCLSYRWGCLRSYCKQLIEWRAERER